MSDQPFKNLLLGDLPGHEQQMIRPFLTRSALLAGQVLVEQNQVLDEIIFVENGLVALMSDASASRLPVQVAMLGREGLAGYWALFGLDNAAPVSLVAQISGPAYRLPVADMRMLMKTCPSLRHSTMRAKEAMIRQIMQTAASNARDTIAERCVRWLLMAHDRVEGDELAITHAALSNLLGVRRSGITIVAAGLQEAGVLRVNRGRITILDRTGLERSAASAPRLVFGKRVLPAARPGDGAAQVARQFR